jgi:type VI secretion system protein ImpE
MKAKQLYQEGKLNEAIQSLSAELRDNPSDAKRRTFLFELLCFAGEYERADKHLNLLADVSGQAKMGAVLYMSAMHGERIRHKTFADKDYPTTPIDESKLKGGTVTLTNGESKAFTWMEDSDPRVGPRFELFAAGAYLWIGYEHIESLEFQPVTKLRDLLWRPAFIRTAESFKGTELGEVLVPALFAFSYKHADDQVRLGRSTVWDTSGEDPIPYGQKTFLIDDIDYSIMELGKVEFNHDTPAGGSGDSE